MVVSVGPQPLNSAPPGAGASPTQSGGTRHRPEITSVPPSRRRRGPAARGRPGRRRRRCRESGRGPARVAQVRAGARRRNARPPSGEQQLDEADVEAGEVDARTVRVSSTRSDRRSCRGWAARSASRLTRTPSESSDLEDGTYAYRAGPAALVDALGASTGAGVGWSRDRTEISSGTVQVGCRPTRRTRTSARSRTSRCRPGGCSTSRGTTGLPRIRVAIIVVTASTRSSVRTPTGPAHPAPSILAASASARAISSA